MRDDHAGGGPTRDHQRRVTGAGEWQLLETITPVVRRVVAQRVAPQEVDDLCGEILLTVAERLRREGDQGFGNVAELDAYFATVAHHACDHHLRRRHPLRWRLRNRLRYVLEHDERFALWRVGDHVWRCGLAGRTTETAGTVPDVSALTVGEQAPREFLLEALTAASGPVDFNAIVALAIEAWRVPSGGFESPVEPGTVADAVAAIDTRLQDRQAAALVWREIQELPLRQRVALLLNLRDDALHLIVSTGVASLTTIASTLEQSTDQLAALWDRLPLPDNEIAAWLGCTRQQVINLRQAARKRLSNRLSSAVNMSARPRLMEGDTR